MVALHVDRIQSRAPQFDGVREGYQHHQKRITPSLEFETSGLRLKWYDIAFTSLPIAPELETEARGFLLGEVEAGGFSAENELGFVLLHDCGDVVFLIISTWRNTNELWETLYVKHPEEGRGFELMRFSGHHRGAYCVWEMGAAAHEAQAWSRYLQSARDASARDTYFFDMYSGLI